MSKRKERDCDDESGASGHGASARGGTAPGAAPSAASHGSAPFLPSATFQGARPGYFFRLGARGPGYYVDRAAGAAAGSVSDAPGSMAPPPPRKPATAAELLAQAEEDAGGERALDGAVLDERSLRKLVLSFERRYAANMEARLKHADAPEKFVDSEVDLDEEIRRLKSLAGHPELYPEFVRLNAVPSILGLFTHDNPDIAADAVELLHELTDADAVESHEEGGIALVESVSTHSGFELVVEALARFGAEETPEEAAAVHAAIGIVENAVEIRPEAADEFCERADGRLMRWLLKRASRKGAADDNKLYAAETLAILVQTSEANRARFGEADGVDVLLRAVAPFKGRDPADDAEEEWLENCFDALCASLGSPANRDAFVRAEGLELMLLMMRSKRACRTAAIKCVDHALTRHAGACERFVDALGLKTAFAAFMGKRLEKTRKTRGADAAAEEEERGISVVASLFANLERGSPRYDRLCAKFVEDEFAKCDRLAELWAAYASRVAAVDARLARRSEDFRLTEEDVYVERLGGGLYTLELVGLIFGSVFASGHAGIRRRLLLQMELQGADADYPGDPGSNPGGGDDDAAILERRLRPVRDVLVTHAENIGGADGEDARLERRARVVKILVALGGGRGGGDGDEPDEKQEGAQRRRSIGGDDRSEATIDRR